MGKDGGTDSQLWVWVEARQVAGEASAVDDWIKVGCVDSCNNLTGC
jgi:hypothetical protein